MTDKNNKQQDRKIMNCISKIICTTYSYIRQLFGFEDNEDVPFGSESSRANTKADATAIDEIMKRELATEEEMRTTWPMKPAAKRKLVSKKRKLAAAKRKKAAKKSTSKSTNISAKKPVTKQQKQS